ncbi:tolloid-like protein 1 [Gigantopelta aegis]|uniref:tolloid-like protein 1 n=1 Tax=Gigantopelta aegis TaxID=1735272 RepID=UPI001B88E200|nr:tolloid-like protein 1 [Gigantopelta aegis]
MLVIAILATFTMCADAVSFNFNVLTCGSNITLTNGDVQFISSPSSMHGSYLNSVNCLWRINVAQGYRILIASNSILLEPSCGCRYDYVELFDPGSRHIVKIGRFCWDRPVQYISTADTMLVRFQSDDSVNTTGFTFSVSRVTPDPANPCNNSITGPGNILSINYPQKYPSNALCFYHIQAPEGNQVNLTFLDFNLEKEPCTSDYLNVYDGPSSASPKIGRYCWRSNPQTIISSSHDLFLQFNSDGRVEDKGFNLQIDFVTEGQDTGFTLVDNPTPESYDPDCIHVIRTLGHNLTSPNSATNGYLKRKHCITTLTAPINHRVQLHFDVIDIEKSNECRFDHVTIVHGTVKSKYNYTTSHDIIY